VNPYLYHFGVDYHLSIDEIDDVIFNRF